MKVSLPVIIDTISTKKDGSVKLVIETREMPPNEMSVVFGLRNTEAWAVFAPNKVQENDVPTTQADAGVGTKTPAQRIRAVLYRLWEQSGKQGEFETYYAAKMERLIDQLKEKLE